MSKKHDFTAQFEAMAKSLLEEIDERNEEFLEQIRILQDDHVSVSEESSAESDNVELSPSPPVVKPRVGISELAEYVFKDLPGEERRLEYMWRFSQMEYAKAAGDWKQWAAYLVMILEGLSNDCIARLIEKRMGLNPGQHFLEAVGLFFQEKEGEPSLSNNLQSHGWGVHERMGVLIPLEGRVFYKILKRTKREGHMLLSTVDEYGAEHEIQLELLGLPVGFFNLEVEGVYLDSKFSNHQRIEVQVTETNFLIGPLPEGNLLRKKEGKPLYKSIKVGGGKTLRIKANRDGSFDQYRWAKVYYPKLFVPEDSGPNRVEVWYLNVAHQGKARRLNELSLIDRILITEKLLSSWNASVSLDLPTKWAEHRASDRNRNVELLIQIRNAYCHNNAKYPHLNPTQMLRLYESRFEEFMQLAINLLSP